MTIGLGLGLDPIRYSLIVTYSTLRFQPIWAVTWPWRALDLFI